MARQVTRWSPDTCDCIIEYEWDDSQPAETRKHSLRRVVSKCHHHATFPDDQILAILMDENPRKNKGIQTILENISELNLEDVGWAYDEDRVLVLNLPAAKADENRVNSLRGLLTAAFGPNKVRVNRI